MDKAPLLDGDTGRLNFEWVYRYSKENNCGVTEAFKEGMRQLGNLYVQLKDFQQKFLESPHEMVRDYEAFCAGAGVMDSRRKEREQPNKDSRKLPVVR